MLIEVNVIITDPSGNKAAGSKRWRTGACSVKAVELKTKIMAGEAFRDAAYAGRFYDLKDR